MLVGIRDLTHDTATRRLKSVSNESTPGEQLESTQPAFVVTVALIAPPDVPDLPDQVLFDMELE